MNLAITVFMIMAVFISGGLWWRRIYRRPDVSPTQVLRGRRISKKTGINSFVSQLNCLIFYLIASGFLKIICLALAVIFLIFSIRFLQPMLRIRSGEIQIAHNDPYRAGRSIARDHLLSIGVELMETKGYNILFCRRDGAPVTFQAPNDDPEFIEALAYFARANDIRFDALSLELSHDVGDTIK